MVLALFTVIRRAHARSSDDARFKIVDMLFEDQSFSVKYLALNSGILALARKVLIPVEAVEDFDLEREELSVDLTREEILHEPLERDVLENIEVSVPATPGVFPLPLTTTTTEPGDPHLWSARDLLGYSLRTGDQIAGHVEDLIVDLYGWRVHRLVIDVRDGRASIDPTTIRKIHWLGATVHTAA